MGRGEAALLHGLLLRLLVILHNVGVDESVAEALILGEVLLEHVEVDDDHADGLADLGRGETHAVAGRVGLEHVLNELLQIGIINGNVLCHLAQHGLPVNVYR